ncbi:MAG: pilus assembly protein [Myxococcales bacterium]|nr:pilus assembly protein [Myxococcales bacterium]
MHRRRPTPLDTPQDRKTGGAIYVEFLVAFIPFFIMVLGIMQIALMYSAHLIVQHAAAAAARSAIVVFPDCEYHYGGAPQNVVNGGGSGGDPASALGTLFGAGSAPGIGLPNAGASGGARLQAIRFAANMPLAATSPSLNELTTDSDPRRQSLINAIGGNMSPALRLALGALAYNNAALAVTFPQAPQSRSFRNSFSARDQLTARVTYLFHCGVPIVNKMACDDAIGLFTGLPHRQLADAARRVRSGRTSLTEIQQAFETVQVARDRLAAARPGMDEMGQSGAGYALSGALLALTGGNFSVIRAEATLPLQGAGGPVPSACYRDR